MSTLDVARFAGQMAELVGGMDEGLKHVESDVATDLAAKARAKASGMGGVFAHVAPSIKAAVQDRMAEVDIDGDSYPPALGAELGSKRFKRFPAYVGDDEGGGYMLGSAAAKGGDDMDSVAMASLLRLLAPVFPE